MKLGDTIFNGNQFKNVILNSTSYKRLILGVNLVWSYFSIAIKSFKTRILADGGTYEGEIILEDRLQEITPNLFDSASLVITPNGVKTSKLYSIKPNDGTGDLTVTRNTSATRVNENGVIVDVPANVARIDYSNGSPAILVEPQRTNLVYPSNIATTQVRAVTAQVYTLSFYGTGTVTLSGAFSGSLVGTGTNNRVSLTFTPTAGNLTLTVSGTVANWQLEAGSNATSLIKTITGSVTRNADVISKTGISSLIGQTEGSIYVETILQKEENFNARVLIAITLNTSDNIFGIGFKDNRIVYIIRNNNGSILTTNASNNIFSNGTLMKICCIYSSSNLKLFVNGVLLTSQTLTNFPNSFNGYTLSGDRVFFSSNLSPLKLIGLYQYVLTDQQAIQLTTL